MDAEWTLRLLILLTAGINICLVLVLLMQKRVLDRTKALATRLQEIGLSGDLSRRVPISGADELSELEHAVNDMLARQEQAQTHIRRLHRLQAVGTLATGIAHEINNPLNVMQLNASALEMFLADGGAVDREAVLARLKTMIREIEKVRDIVRHMRAIARPEGKRALDAVNLRAAIGETTAMLEQQLASHGIELRTNVPELEVRADRLELEQVMLNLLGNARDAITEGAGADLSASGLGGKTIEIRAAREDGAAVVEILDTGPGLGGNDDHLFDPFFTTKETGKGMGMGLAIVHTLVTGWGGYITARDRAGGGAHFTFSLPLAEAQSPGGQGGEGGA